MKANKKPTDLVILPWLWISLGILFCLALGGVIKDLAHASGPGTGGALLLLPITAALYPVGLAWIGVGLLLLFEHRWASPITSLASILLLMFTAIFFLMPSAIPVALILSAFPVTTLLILRSRKTQEYRNRSAAAEALRLESIRQGIETPAVVPLLSRSWMTVGSLLFLSWPLTHLYFRFFGAAAEGSDREFAVMIAVGSIPFGVLMLWIGYKLKSAGKGTARAARALLVFGWLGLIPDAFAFPSIVAISTLAFFYLVSGIALSQPAFKAYCARNGT